MTNVHLCNTYRQMLMALSDILARGEPAMVVYLQDFLPIGVPEQRRLQDICSNVEFVYSSDAIELQAFRQLPRWLPEILSRNIRFNKNGRPIRPHHWRPDYLKGKNFTTGYVYHSGFFMSKIIAGISNEIVLREDGYTNYTPHNVPSYLKRLFRWIHGLPPHIQIFGEEKWVTRIEMSSPERLPPSIRYKARQLLFDDLMQALPEEKARELALTFAPELPVFEGAQSEPVKTALLLTQPIEDAGMRTLAQKTEIYQDIVDWLVERGYLVFVKNHPREKRFELRNTIRIPSAFPIEAWPFASHIRFHVGVSLCTSALLHNRMSFVESAVQLIAPETFFASSTASWPSQIERNLDKFARTL